MGSVRNFILFLLLFIGYHESVFQISSNIIYRHGVTLGKCYECCIFSLVGYRVS